MTNYRAPTGEMLFVLNELAGIQQLAALPGFEDATPDMVGAILEEAGKLAADVLAPLNQAGDQQGSRLVDGNVISPDGFADAYQKFVESGWAGISQPPEYGGQGLPFLLQMVVAEMWNSANISFSLSTMLAAGAIEAMRTHGTNELNDRYLHKMVSGEWPATMNLTEPQAGSDLAAVRSRAEPEGDHYRIFGTKIFITWGDHDLSDNIVHLVLARLPDAPEGVKGISLFLVPKLMLKEDGTSGELNDVRAVSVEHKLGIHASPTCVMSFGDGDGAIAYLVGEENNGLACMFTMMNHARLGVGVQGVGMSEIACQAAAAYARERVQGVAPGHEGRVAIIEHADVRRMLMQMRAQTEASRALAYVAIAAHDFSQREEDAGARQRRQQRVDLLTPIVKAWCTELAQEVTTLGIQVHGGMGYIEETGAAQYYRDARITPIYEGTNGIQAMDLVGRKLLRDGGAAWSALYAELQEFQTELAGTPEESLRKMSGAFSTALDALSTSTEWLLEHGARDPNIAASAAFNYLMLMGTVLGGWLMAKGALAAHRCLKSGDGDEDFYRARITVAKFYIEHLLPRAGSYAASVTAGSESIMGLSADQL